MKLPKWLRRREGYFYIFSYMIQESTGVTRILSGKFRMNDKIVTDANVRIAEAVTKRASLEQGKTKDPDAKVFLLAATYLPKLKFEEDLILD